MWTHNDDPNTNIPYQQKTTTTTTEKKLDEIDPGENENEAKKNEFYNLDFFPNKLLFAIIFSRL